MKRSTHYLLLLSGCLLQLLTASPVHAQTKSIDRLDLTGSGSSNCNQTNNMVLWIDGEASGYDPGTTKVSIHLYYGDGKDTTFVTDSIYGKISHCYFQCQRSHDYLPGAYQAKVIAEMPDGQSLTALYDFTIGSCKTIGGKIFADINKNCQFDAGDVALKNVGVALSSGNYIKTDANGSYEFTVPDNQTYTARIPDMEYLNAVSKAIICPTGGSFDITSLPASNVDFAFNKTVIAGQPDRNPHYQSQCQLNSTYSFNFLAFLIGYSAADHISFHVTFGDGEDTTIQYSPLSAYDSATVMVNHKYQSYGLFDVAFDIAAPDLQTDGIVYKEAVRINECASITGKIFADFNENCIMDGNELPVSDILLRLVDANNKTVVYAYSAGDGSYSINAPDKNQVYTLKIDKKGTKGSGGFVAICPASNEFLINSFPAVKDFALRKGPVFSGVYVDPGNVCVSPVSEHFGVNMIEVGMKTGENYELKVLFGDGSDTIVANIPDTGGMYKYFDLYHFYKNPGNYSIRFIVKDGDGRADTLDSYDMCNISDTCAVISGRVFQDNNGDCNFNSGEPAFQYAMVTLKDNGTVVNYAYTDQFGNYYFPVKKGGAHNYSVALNYDKNNYTSCRVNGEIVIANLPANDNDFGLACMSKFDLVGYIGGWGFRPGSKATIDLGAYNQSCDEVNATVKWVKNPFLTVESSFPAPDNTIGDTLIWNVSGISSTHGFYAYIKVLTSTAATLNDSISGDLFVDPVKNDQHPADNNVHYVFPVKNSWDPNMKTAAINGNTIRELIPMDTREILYTVFFQNTGNDVAYNISVLDTLDKNIEPSSIKIIGSSHAMKAYIPTGGILKFNFNDIMLPDDKSNETGSHGFVTYMASLKPGLSSGSQVKNTARIFFDYNPAIITNTTQNILSHTAGISVVKKADDLLVYPNPVSASVSVEVNKGLIGGTIEIIDVLGKVKMNQNIDGSRFSLNVNSLPTGMYFIKATKNDIIQNVRISVIH